MDQKPSLDIVYLAIASLYNNPNATEKERASQWLCELQKSVYAWSVADEILHQKRDLESCYFAAHTMRTKIHQSFHELPLTAHASLRDSLLEHISQINEGTNTVIVTRLCLALADMTLQMPTWKRAPIDLITKFSQSNLWPLLEILTVMPEELENRSLRLGDNRRYEVIDDLKSCAPTILEFLKHCSNNFFENGQDNLQVTIKILRCFTSWVSIGAITLNDITDNIVISKAFTILGAKPEGDKPQSIPGSLHDAATDCVCTLLQCLEDNNNQQQLETYLFNNIINLEVSYHLSVANEDQEKSMNYCRIFTELGETFLEKIISNSSSKSHHYAIKILDLVLICVGHHDYEVAEITFNLWYVLSEELYQKSNRQMTELFRPYVERLITALCRHCQMEPDHEGLLDDGDDFKDFRCKVSDLIKDVVFIVGSSSCFRQMFINLQSTGVTWDANEASLFVMQAVAKSVLPTENEVVPKVVEAILNLPENTHVAVRHTSVMLLGELCEWVEEHPTTLDHILHFLVCCLPQPGIGAAAATAIQNICASCNDVMPRHVPVMFELLERVDTFAITNDAVIGLLKGVASIVGVMAHNELPMALMKLCSMQVTPLLELLEKDVVPVRGTKTDPVLWLDRLSSVFRNCNVTLTEGAVNPCKPVIMEVWPVLSRTFDKYQSDVRIMERSCRTVRFMLRCVSGQLCELLESLVGQMVRIYGLYKHSCFLYVGSILVDEYATESICVQGLLDMLQAFIEPTFQLLREENGLRNHPDTVDDFFRLCARFMQRSPTTFLRCPTIVPILQCGLMAIQLDHKEANTSVMKFFYDLINTGQFGKNQENYEERRALVRGIVDEYGQQLVTNLVHGSVFFLHSYMLSEVADVIVELLDFNREQANKMIANSLDSLPKQQNGIVAATDQQLSDIHQSLIKSNTSKAITHILKDLTRLYR